MRRVTTLVSAATIIAALTACTGPAANPPVPATADGSPAHGCDWVADSAERLWDPMLTGEAGYGEPLNLATRPSLYWTSWSLRIAAELGERRPPLPDSRIRDYLASSFEKPSAEDEQVAPLMRVSLVAAALASLPRGMTSREKVRVESLVEGFRHGSAYAWSSTGRPDPAATMIAVAALRDAELPVPDLVVADVRRLADHIILSNVSDEEITTSGIPRLVALVLADNVVTSHERAGFRVLIDDWRERVISQGVGAIQISALYWLDVVGREIGAPSEVIADDWLDAVTTPAGYVEAQPGAGGDAQTTYYAVHLGALDGQSLERSLGRRLGDQGWIATISPVDLAATSHIVTALRVCGLLDGARFPIAVLPRPRQLAAGLDPRSAGQVCSILAAFPHEAQEWGGDRVDCESTMKDLRSWWRGQAGANLLGSALDESENSSAADEFCREDLCWFLPSGDYSDRDIYSTAIHAAMSGLDDGRRSQLLLEFARGTSYSTNPEGEADHQVDSMTLLGVAILAARDLAPVDTLMVV